MGSKTGEEENTFPSELERSVASALLRISESSSPRREGDYSYSTESFESTGFFDPKSGGEQWKDEEVSADGESLRSQRLTVVAFVAGVTDLKFKVVRKKRSRTVLISDGRKSKTTEPTTPLAPTSSDSASEIASADNPCLSISSTAQTTLSSESSTEKKLKKPGISRDMENRADAILRILLTGKTSEVKIRQLLGDSPSTSKALRMLLKLDEVKRVGAGGRHDPYIYMVAR